MRTRSARRTLLRRKAAAVLDLVPADHLPTAADLDEGGGQLMTALAPLA